MIQDVTPAEIKAEIEKLETTSRHRLKYLRALLKVVEWETKETDGDGSGD